MRVVHCAKARPEICEIHERKKLRITLRRKTICFRGNYDRGINLKLKGEIKRWESSERDSSVLAVARSMELLPGASSTKVKLRSNTVMLRSDT